MTYKYISKNVNMVKNLGELHKKWTEAGVHQESPRSDIFRKRVTKPLLKQKHCQKHPCCLKSSVKFPQSVMVWAAMSSAGVGPLCFLKSTVNAAIYQDILEHFMLPSADKLYGDPDFIFQQDLAPAHTVKDTKSWWPWCYCAWLASKLAWPEPHWESIGYCQEEDERHQTQQCRWPEGRYQSNLGFHTTWAVPQADYFHATPHWCSNSYKRRPNQVLSA